MSESQTRELTSQRFMELDISFNIISENTTNSETIVVTSHQSERVGSLGAIAGKLIHTIFLFEIYFDAKQHAHNDCVIGIANRHSVLQG